MYGREGLRESEVDILAMTSFPETASSMTISNATYQTAMKRVVGGLSSLVDSLVQAFYNQTLLVLSRQKAL